MDKILKYYKEHSITPQGETYLILGNTFAIKDELKECGCHFDKTLGWHSSIDLPQYKCLKINVNDYLVWENNFNYPIPKQDAEARIKNLVNPPKPLEGKYYEGSVVENQIVELVARSEFTGRYGLQYRYVMVGLNDDKTRNDYTFVWFTKSNIAYDKGDVLYITSANVKEHQEFNGRRQTIITRARWEGQK